MVEKRPHPWLWVLGASGVVQKPGAILQRHKRGPIRMALKANKGQGKRGQGLFHGAKWGQAMQGNQTGDRRAVGCWLKFHGF